MTRKILSGALIAFSTLLLLLSIAGIGSVWVARGPLTRSAVGQLQTMDHELEQAQTAVQSTRLELERTLRLVESAETSMSSLKDSFSQIKDLFDNTNDMLNNQLLPGLNTSRGKIDDAKNTFQDLRNSLAKINSLPLVDLNLPGDKLLSDLISTAGSLDDQIAKVEDTVKNTSTFVSDASYLVGGDFTETKTNLQNFLTTVTEYDQKLTHWRDQINGVENSLRGWITGASIGLTIFLLWFGFSQFSLILHGLTIWQGRDPFAVLRKPIGDDIPGV